ncbi:MAG: undecaprenyldiphospho-muramoylpentapeptide beta-N-acetylglucosaminyltransferase [Chloroflexota bacterium]|nr:undecaprenyldiphospho-muramoylpentapeptide beta-N-acetylglucosaminyltransferase [Chloroflexota bacterium]
MRLWIVGGGTGGHVYPGLAVVQAIQNDIKSSATLIWVGGLGGMEAQLVERAGLPFLGIPAGGVHGVGVRRMVRNLGLLAQGFVAAWREISRARPAAILTTGGYVSMPVVVTAWLRHIPVLVFVPDIEPALSVKLAGKLATRIGVTVAESASFFASRKVEVTGYPLRQEIVRWERTTGRRALRLDADEPALLVFGGSRGARSLNRAVLAHLPALLAETQLVHISGDLGWEEVSQARQTLPVELRARYHIFPYLYEKMGAALAAADLVLSRAGASTLGEFPHFGLPALLVPYPYSWRYQQINAEWLAEHGAAQVLPDAELQERLMPLVQDLLHDEARRQAMSVAAQKLAYPRASRRLAELLLALGEEA